MAQALTLPNPRDGLARSVALLSARGRRFWLAWAGRGYRGWRRGLFVARAARRDAGRAPGAAAAARPPDRARAGAAGQPDDPDRRRTQPGRPALRLQGQFSRPLARARMPRQRGLLRGRRPGRQRRACRRPGRPQPRPPPGLSGKRLRRRLSGIDPRHRLPVHLHLRRLALSPARRRRVEPGLAHRFGRAVRLGLCAGRLRDPLPCRLRGPLLGLDPGEECGRRSAYFLSLGRRLGRSGRVSPRPIRAASPTSARCAAPRLRRRPRPPDRPAAKSPRRSPTSPARRRFRSTPSMRGDKRVAIRFNLTARKASEAAPHDDYVEKFKASDNLRWSLSDEAVAANEKPLGQAKAPASRSRRPRPASPSRWLLRSRQQEVEAEPAQAQAQPAAGSGRAGRRSPDNRSKGSSPSSSAVRSPQAR